MRYRVDTRFGYASFDECDKEKALALYKEEGLRLRLCEHLGDEGTAIDGLPDYVDIHTKAWLAA